MLFKEVIGQEEIKQRLIRSVKSERIAHAQLLFGPAGTGKLPLALAYAQYINCDNPGEDESCGVCPSCVKYARLAHPDLHFVYPVVNTKSGGKSAVSDDYIERWREQIVENPYLSENQWYEAIGAENKQGLISRNESNEVLKKLSLKSFEAPYKVLIIWLAEKMNPSAANALLKLIEEPPSGTVFLLISENTDKILTTIRSRTQLIRLAPIDSESMHKALMLQYPAREEMMEDVLRRSAGNFSKAIELMESDQEEDKHFEAFVFLMRRCYQRDIVAIQKWTEETGSWGREQLKLFLSYCLRMIRENFILNMEQEQITYLSKKESDFSIKFSAFIHEGNVFSMAEEFQKAIEHIEANGYARLVLLDLAIKNIMLLKQPKLTE